MPDLRATSLAGIGIVLLGMVACLGEPTSSSGAPAESGMARVPAADTVEKANLDMRLKAMAGPRPEMARGSRNPFRFGSEPLGAQPDAEPVPDPEPVSGVAPGDLLRPETRRPPLKFIGLVDAPNSAGLIGVLTDGEVVFQGRVGDTVDGRYRITRIAADTVELELLPAGGRYVLRMEGP